MARAPRRVETAWRRSAARDFKKPGTWTRRRDKRARVIPGRIKHHPIPFRIDQPGRGRNALPEFASAAGRGKPELQLDPADALRHIRMQRVPVGQIAASGDDAGRCRRFPRRPRWPADRGRMLAGNPLRAVQRQRAGHTGMVSRTRKILRGASVRSTCSIGVPPGPGDCASPG